MKSVANHLSAKKSFLVLHLGNCFWLFNVALVMPSRRDGLAARQPFCVITLIRRSTNCVLPGTLSENGLSMKLLMPSLVRSFKMGGSVICAEFHSIALS